MEHRVWKSVGKANCSACGRKITTVHEIDGVNYGSECASKILGRDVSAPAWLYELAEEYLAGETTLYHNLGDLPVNFFGQCGTKLIGRNGEALLWDRTVQVQGKRVYVDWQYEIAHYLEERYCETTGRRYDEYLEHIGP